jgi:hypothetical protein
MLVRVLQVLIVIKRDQDKGGYIKAIVTQLLVILHQQTTGLPHWKMLKHNLAAWNEETGELAFAVLSRCILGDATKSKFEHLDAVYTLLHTYREMDEDLRTDNDIKGPKQNWKTRVKSDHEAVQATVAWLKERMRRLQHHDVSIYDGSDQGTKSLAKAAEHMEPRKHQKPMYDEAKQAHLIDKWMTRAQDRLVRSDWGATQQAIWPECSPVEENQYGDDGQEGDVGSDYEQDQQDYDGEEGSDANIEVIQPEMSQQELLDKIGDPRESKYNHRSCESSDGDLTQQFSDGSAEDEDESWRRPSRDVNARGERVSWDQWGWGG